MKRIIELPCDVGDILYVIEHFDNEFNLFPMTVQSFVVCEDDVLIKYDPWDGVMCKVSEIGKIDGYLEYRSVFLTEEERDKTFSEWQNKLLAERNELLIEETK